LFFPTLETFLLISFPDYWARKIKKEDRQKGDYVTIGRAEL